MTLVEDRRPADSGLVLRFVTNTATSAGGGLYLSSSDATIDKVVEAFEGQHMELIKSSMSHEQENALREAFGEDDED